MRVLTYEDLLENDVQETGETEVLEKLMDPVYRPQGESNGWG